MSLLAKLMIAAGLVAALSAAGVGVHHSIYASGVRDGEAKVRKEIDDATAETARLNKTIVKKDQAIIVAKTQDKEKIKIIYRTIREQLAPEIIEIPVYRDVACSIPASGMRLIAQAAAGNVPADTDHAKGNPASQPAGAEK